ncbi:hypothetical protein [Megamonas hypermegale]|uniref:hypothetical protein n=1 Tax=Megamonas hypermegale TaxID=158847 RepID=UPI00195B3375|nr:hypothetical protein [Megamonas hypermegale]MBM6832651.1 hypothetical protein [Megamonas hypermegale]
MVKKIKANFRQVGEIIALVIVVLGVYILDIFSLFKNYLMEYELKPELGNIILYYLLNIGNIGLSIVLFWRLLKFFRKINKEFIMNNSNVYHDYPFFWYWFCARILGIKKCNLILVPIYMQFKLVIEDIFDEYPLDEDDFPVIKDEADSDVKEINMDMDMELSEINLILEDTYVIESRQIPFSKKDLPTIKISRNINNNHTRHFSPKFIQKISEEIRKLPQINRINIYATTNPMNTLRIIRTTFKMADRGNIDHIFVYQQENKGIRVFCEKGYKIY